MTDTSSRYGKVHISVQVKAEARYLPVLSSPAPNSKAKLVTQTSSSGPVRWNAIRPFVLAELARIVAVFGLRAAGFLDLVFRSHREKRDLQGLQSLGQRRVGVAIVLQGL